MVDSVGMCRNVVRVVPVAVLFKLQYTGPSSLGPQTRHHISHTGLLLPTERLVRIRVLLLELFQNFECHQPIFRIPPPLEGRHISLDLSRRLDRRRHNVVGVILQQNDNFTIPGDNLGRRCGSVVC